MNTFLQILSHTTELNSFLDKNTYKTKIKTNVDGLLFIEWDKLRKSLWLSSHENNNAIAPTAFHKTMRIAAKIKGNEMFAGHDQNDVGEFILFIIDCLHNALAREIQMNIRGTPTSNTDTLAVKCFEMIRNMYSKNYSEIWNLFYAVQVSEAMNAETKDVISLTPEPFFMIDLPIPPVPDAGFEQSLAKPNNASLEECFAHYVAFERIDDFKCDKTNEIITIQKRMMFWSFPIILVINLKRFNGNLRKSHAHITFPLDCLDLSSYVVGYNRDGYKYQLYGVCNHYGSTLGGHYTAYVRASNDEWYCFNDTVVTRITDLSKIVSPNAYVLFYRKIRI